MSDRHQWLDEALRLAAAEDARTIVPGDVETRVMRAWDDRHAGSAAPTGHGSSRAAWIAAAGVAAACAVALVWLPPAGGLRPETQPSERQSPSLREGGGRTPETASATAVVAEPGTLVATPRARVIAPARVHESAGGGAMRSETRSTVDLGPSDFVLIPEPPADATTLQVVRVRMSRTAFASLGVPIENPDADGLMEVEMIVGDDGVARSIRRAAFVSVVDEREER